jgi:hypothetical protein
VSERQTKKSLRCNHDDNCDISADGVANKFDDEIHGYFLVVTCLFFVVRKAAGNFVTRRRFKPT